MTSITFNVALKKFQSSLINKEGLSMNWQELADMINSEKGHQLLQIGWIDEMEHVAYMQYQRALIQRVVFHENLFSIYLAWEAFLDPFTNIWILTNCPKDDNDKNPVQIIDSNVTSIQPLVMEMPYGKKIIRIRYRMHQGLLVTTEIDPLSIDLDKTAGIPKITYKQGPEHNIMETGSWIIPPNCGPSIKPVKPCEVNNMVN